MFTGIVRAKGKVGAVERNAFGARLVIQGPGSQWIRGRRPERGDSMCVGGVCLTLTHVADTTMSFDIVAETLAKTTVGDLTVGDEVNLEPALTAEDPLGGHFVQGHVDGVGRITALKADAGERRVSVEPPAELVVCIVPKGSVTVDGVSLTVASVAESVFEVALIPETLQRTTLGDRQVGDRVNLETDVVSKTIVHWLQRQNGREVPTLTMERLRNAGFVE